MTGNTLYPKGKIPGYVKPCAEEMLRYVFSEMGEQEFDEPKRAHVCHVIATELLRFKTPEEALEILKEWNSKNKPPLEDVQVMRAIEHAHRTGHTYGCNNAKLEFICGELGGKEACSYYQDFIKLNYPESSS